MCAFYICFMWNGRRSMSTARYELNILYPFLFKWHILVVLQSIDIFNTMKLNMYSVWHNYVFILLLLLYYWLQVSALKGHHQANIYKKLKMLVHTAQKRLFYGIPFTFISSLVIIIKTTNECQWNPIKLPFFVLYVPEFYVFSKFPSYNQ